MTKEELLRPRYKIVQDYPGNPHEIGHILNYIPGQYWDEKQIATCDKYPHLFKKLLWHEERKKDEMPEYVKVIDYPGYGKILKTVNWEFEVFWACEDISNGHSYMQDELVPSDKEEYNAYLNSKNESKS